MISLVKMQFGSHVYGTNLATSDLDYKNVFVPNGYELVMQNATNHISYGTKQDSSKKNQPGDIDEEFFSIQKYMKLLMDGQTVALDMLFTPSSFYIGDVSQTWTDIQNNRQSFIHSGTAAFVGYCRQQAAKYGVKGSRIQAMRSVLNLISEFKDNKTLLDYSNEIDNFVFQYCEDRKLEGSNTDKELFVKYSYSKDNKGNEYRHLEVCNKKMPMHASVKYAKEVYNKIFNEWGSRALLAEQNQGVDWKACMHAVRVAYEAQELLSTGFITFPRPEASLLLEIRQGLLPYSKVEILIEEGLVAVEASKRVSTLPKEPDSAAFNRVIYSAHMQSINEYLITKP